MTSKNVKRAPWIVVSGMDGAGKTALCDKLENYMISNGKCVKRSQIPHDRYLTEDLHKACKDSYTDCMLFALDNRLFANYFEEWQNCEKYDVILTNQGYLDSFIHAAIHGFSYSWIANLTKIHDLPKCDVIIHMVADAETAYSRINDEPDANKFEFIRRQEHETRRGFCEVVNGNPDLKHFHDALNIYVDTTTLSIEATFQYVLKRLIQYEII